VDLSESSRVAAGARGSEEVGEGSNKPDSKNERNETMKKIMIVAAIAAIAGGAFAEGYNFSATLKTTQGRKGTDAITTLNLGKLGSTFWYEDALYADITQSNTAWQATKLIDGVSVPTVAKTKTKDGTTVDMNGSYLLYADSTNYAFAVSALKTLANTYNQRSAGRWCETIKVIDPASCYRVAGTKKINQDFVWEYDEYIDCCTEVTNVPWTVAAGAFTNGVAGGETVVAPATSFVFDNGLMAIAYSTNQVVAPISAVSTLYQRFGAQASNRANRLEIYAGIPYAYTDDGYLFAGWIAGQGTALFADSMDASTISGNIVGVIEAPTCENCCTAPTPSWAFDCANGTTAAQLPYSAAYGTFRIRYVRNLR
jgi:hypothetical protein